MATVTKDKWLKTYRALIDAKVDDKVSRAADLAALDEIRVLFLGRNGELTALLKLLKDLSLEDRKELGPLAQSLKAGLEKQIARKKARLEAAADEVKTSSAELDLTLPPYRPPRGRLHPLTQTLDEIARIFTLMGFSWAEGPLIEDDEHNFTALNIPAHHSARDMHDTFYVQGTPLLLRTHTSPVQIRALRAQKPPLRIICPGRVFRREAVDATHSAVFHQVEGLAVDRKISFADLKGTLQVFLRRLLGASTKMLFRPTYFPFTEPSADVYATCLFCAGKGCAVCKRSGWIELLGAGVVHPNVLKGVGLDPREWSGFAFGIGVERVAMLRLGVRDIRLFYENDARFLRQFDENIAALA